MNIKELTERIHELEVKFNHDVRKLKQQYAKDNSEWQPGDTICTVSGCFKVMAMAPFFGAKEVAILYKCKRLNKDHSVTKRAMPCDVFQSDVISGVKLNNQKTK
jgi:hypothetical protein